MAVHAASWCQGQMLFWWFSSLAPASSGLTLHMWSTVACCTYFNAPLAFLGVCRLWYWCLVQQFEAVSDSFSSSARRQCMHLRDEMSDCYLFQLEK